MVVLLPKLVTMGSETKAGHRMPRRFKLVSFALFVIAAYCTLTFDSSTDRPIILRNAAGSEVHVLLTGGAIQRLRVPDRKGELDDVVLGFDSESEYAECPYFGAVVGRVANRIANATFDLNGKTYFLSVNEAGMPGSLHGGRRGLDKVRWSVKERAEDFVLLQYHSADGEEGYPGAVDFLIRYQISPRSELVFDVSAHTTEATPISIAQHSYFNLAGHSSGSMLDHELTLHHANHVLPIDSHRIPTGELRPVEGGPFDFLTPHALGSRIHKVDGPGWTAGYDHCFVIDAENRSPTSSSTSIAAPPLRLVATLHHPASGRVMEVHSTLPGLQLYTSNFLDGSIVGKGGAIYRKYAGVCLETEGLPDAVHHPHFPSIILQPTQTLRHRTVYSFSTR